MNKQIRLIGHKGGMAVVEYMDGKVPVRVVVEDAYLNGTDEIEETILEQALPYGVPFSELLPSITITGEDMERVFHQNGIFTVEDFMRDSKIVASCLMQAMGLTYSSLLAIIKEYSRKG